MTSNNIIVEPCYEIHKYLKNTLKDYNPKNSQIENIDEQVLSKIVELTKYIWDNVSQNKATDKHIESDENLYNGNAGIAYMFWYLSRQTLYFNERKRKDFLSKALQLMKQSLTKLSNQKSMQNSSQSCNQSYIKGNVGILVVACLIFEETANEEMRDYYLESLIRFAQFYLPIKFKEEGNDTFFIGRAGYICASLLINKYFKFDVIPNELIKNLAFSLVKSGTNGRSSKHKSQIIYRYDNLQYFGNSKGYSGILLSLLSIPSLLADEKYKQLLKESVDFVLSYQKANGMFTRVINSLMHCQENEEGINWCTGAAGIAWLFAKAFNVFKLEKYKNASIRCGEIVWNRGLYENSSGLCHGICGNGYTFLLLYKLTADLKYLHRAKEFAKFIISKDYLQENNKKLKHPFGLFEGYSGVCLFLIDVLKKEPTFPLFFDIFPDESYQTIENNQRVDNDKIEADFSKYFQNLIFIK